MTGRFRAVVIAVLAVAAIAAGLGTRPAGKPSTTEKLAADPAPVLFTDAQVAATGKAVESVRGDAARRIRAWVTAHGTRADDAAFATWLEHTFPAPPADLAAQLPAVVALSRSRTSAGVRAATWLEVHGKKDLWKLYAHDQRELLTAGDAKALKKEEKAALALAKQVADDLGARFGSAAPYVRDPSLRPDHVVKPGQRCPCSYPSRHAAVSAASETLLGHLAPDRDGQYRHAEDEIDFSRVYMAGHFPSDLTAGALLGDLVGDYLLITRQGVDPASLG